MHLLFQHTYVPGQNKQHREQRTTAPSHVKKLTITTTSTSITNDEVIMVINSTCYIYPWRSFTMTSMQWYLSLHFSTLPCMAIKVSSPLLLLLHPNLHADALIYTSKAKHMHHAWELEQEPFWVNLLLAQSPCMAALLALSISLCH